MFVDRNKQFQADPERTPKAYVQPHMDIQCHIDRFLDSLSQSVSDLQVLHVFGHQDTKKKSRLSWLEQLNVRADQLVTFERYHLGLRKF